MMAVAPLSIASGIGWHEMSLPKEFIYTTWVIYYGDGSTFSNDDGKPEDAPCTGVLAVCCFNMDNQRSIHASKDWYIYDEQPIYKDIDYGMWYGADWGGLYQYIARPGKKIIKLGALVSDPTWRKMLERIHQEFPGGLGPRTPLLKA